MTSINSKLEDNLEYYICRGSPCPKYQVRLLLMLFFVCFEFDSNMYAVMLAMLGLALLSANLNG